MRKFGSVALRLGGEAGQGVAGEALGGPLVHPGGTDGAVKGDGGLVPVQDRPLEPAVSALDADPGQLRQQRPAVAVAPLLLTDEQPADAEPR
jgi:hypothetical protein